MRVGESMSTQRLFLLSALLFVIAWLLMWPRGGYSQTATATYIALLFHVVAAVLVNVGAYSKPRSLNRMVLVAFGSLSLLALAALFAASNLFFWNGDP